MGLLIFEMEYGIKLMFSVDENECLILLDIYTRYNGINIVI
jgi:hypothetical protein